jgi:hypothetical protein
MQFVPFPRPRNKSAPMVSKQMLGVDGPLF